MRFNTKGSNLFIRTRGAIRGLFGETRSLRHWLNPAEQRHYRDECPAAILHIKGAYAAINRKEEPWYKTAGRILGLLLSAIIEFPLLVIRNLVIDLIHGPLSLICGFIVDVPDLVLNIVQDIASLPGAFFKRLADKPQSQEDEDASPDEEVSYLEPPSQRCENRPAVAAAPRRENRCENREEKRSSDNNTSEGTSWFSSPFSRKKKATG